MRRFSALAAALLLLLTACAPAEKDAGATQHGSYRPDDLVLRVDASGGFVPVETTVTSMPMLSVYGDGRVLTLGPVIEIYPGPALPNVQVQRISTADVDKLVGLAVDAGVGRAGELGMPNVADAPTTRIMVRTAAGELVTDAPALGIAEDSLSGSERASRKKLQDLVDALTDLPKTLGQSAAGEPKPFAATGVAVVASKWTAEGSDEGLQPQPPQEWPGPALPGAAVADRPGVNCVSATGEQAARVLEAAAKANSRTPWTSSGSTWQVTFRPLLPDEGDCSDLTDR